MPVSSGLVGHYLPGAVYGYQSGTSKRWLDVSSAKNHATTFSAGIVYMATETNPANPGYLKGQPFAHGNTGASVTFPTAILPANYTLFHVVRYDPSTATRSTRSSSCMHSSLYCASPLLPLAPRRYNGTANRGRIIASSNLNWLSGHYGTNALGRMTGMARRPDPTGFITANNDLHGDGWVLSTDMRMRWGGDKASLPSHGACRL